MARAKKTQPESQTATGTPVATTEAVPEKFSVRTCTDIEALRSFAIECLRVMAPYAGNDVRIQRRVDENANTFHWDTVSKGDEPIAQFYGRHVGRDGI